MHSSLWLYPLLLLLPFLDCRTTVQTPSSNVSHSTQPHSQTVSPSFQSSGTSAVPNPTRRLAAPSNTTTSSKEEHDDEELAVTRKMNVHVEYVKGHGDSSYRERLLKSVYVIRERVVVLKAVSSLPVDPPINLNLSWNPQKYAKNGWCHRVNPDTPFEEFVCRCFYGYGGRFCSLEKHSKRWLGWIWWPLILTEIAFLLFALARFWKRWTLPPAIEPRRFVEFIMSDGWNPQDATTQRTSSTHK